MKRILLAMLLVMPAIVQAQTITLRWDAYPEPQGHAIEAWCKVGASEFAAAGSMPADKTSMVIDRAVAPGESVACKVRAVRASDNAASTFTPEVVWARPLDPATPTGLVIETN